MGGTYMDIPRAYTALAEWAACMLYFFMFQKRRGEKKKYGFCGLLLIAQSVYLVCTGNVTIYLWIPCMIGAAVIMLGFIFWGIGMTFLRACYICAKAFLFAEFTASLEWQIHSFLFAEKIEIYNGIQLLCVCSIYFFAFFSLYYVEKKSKTEEYMEVIGKKESVVVMIVTAIVFAASNLSFVFSHTPFTSSVREAVFNIRTLVDLCGITVLMVLQSRTQELVAEKELFAMHMTLKSQYEQYRNYQENFEMMNMKYHDIKHQITGLRAEKDDEKRNEWLKELERELDIMGDTGHTGSNVLDGILAAKSLFCRKHRIKITCVVDGGLLQNIHVVDLCTIFGNALDNAIECVSMISEEEKRLIHFSVSKMKGFIFIQIENYCENELKIGKNKLPVTSKENSKEHGYGMKSIRQTVEKYGGSMEYYLRENWFELVIIIPCSQ